MYRSTCCLGVCGCSVGVGAVVTLALAIVLGTDYNGLNGAVEKQIDDVSCRDSVNAVTCMFMMTVYIMS